MSRLSLEATSGQDFVARRCPSSSAPDLPVVAGLVPAFSRQVTETDTSITVDHDGRVLRLHLDRPWFSSGAGELLVGDRRPRARPSLRSLGQVGIR